MKILSILYALCLSLFIGSYFWPVLISAKKEKNSLEKQKFKKNWPKEYVGKTFETLTVTGPANFQGITVLEKAVVTGPAIIKKSIVSKLVLTGSLDATDVNFSSATITGSVSIVNCTSKENFFVTGAFKSFKSSFEILDITGSVLLNDSAVKARLKVTGTLNVINSILQDTEITTNSKITFENSSANSLIVRKNQTDWWLFGCLIYSDKDKPQVVDIYLKGKSSINNIEFEPGVTGTVILEDKTVSIGIVKNGITKKFPY